MAGNRPTFVSCQVVKPVHKISLFLGHKLHSFYGKGCLPICSSHSRNFHFRTVRINSSSWLSHAATLPLGTMWGRRCRKQCKKGAWFTDGEHPHIAPLSRREKSFHFLSSQSSWMAGLLQHLRMNEHFFCSCSWTAWRNAQCSEVPKVPRCWLNCGIRRPCWGGGGDGNRIYLSDFGAAKKMVASPPPRPWSHYDDDKE